MIRPKRLRPSPALLAAMILGAGSFNAHGATAPPTPRLSTAGRWLTDPEGRVVIIHGSNAIALVGDAQLGGAGADKSRWRASIPHDVALAGFNGVRLIVFMDRIAPEPGRIDATYLDAVAKTVAAYKAEGIFVLLDLHQDEYGPSVGVRGMPGWMTLTDGRQRAPGLAFPNGYFHDPAVQAAFDNFWADKPAASGLGVQEAYLAAATALAGRFAREPAVFGLDLMNEPATGTPCSQPTPKAADCPQLEDALLAPFYAKAGRAIAAAAPQTILFVEPFMLQGALGVPIHTPMPGLARQGLSFHNYGPFRQTRMKVSAFALADAAGRQAALLNTEWGNSDDAGDIAAQAQDFDDQMIPWLAWGREPLEAMVDPQAAPVRANRQAVLRALARPYPAATAGTPAKLAFDADAGMFDYCWSTRGPDGVDRSGRITRIVMPMPSFPGGYRAQIAGGRILSAPSAVMMLVRADRGADRSCVHAVRLGELDPLTHGRANAGPGGRLSLDSLLSDLLRDPEARGILDSRLPSLKSADATALAPQASLRSLQPYLPEMSEAVAKQIDAELRALPPH